MKARHNYYYKLNDIHAIFKGFFFNYEQKALQQLKKYYGNDKKYYFYDSGRTALSVLFRALKYDKGSEIIIPVNCCPVVSKVVIENGLAPIYIDINYNLTIDTHFLEEIISSNTKAIINVATYGNVPDNDKIEEICSKYNIDLIQDLATTFTAKDDGRLLTEFGIASIFSLDVTKSINVFGGGILAINNKKKFSTKQFHLPRQGLFVDLKRIIKLLAFKFLTVRIIYKHLTVNIIDKISKEYYYSPLYKRLSKVGIALFSSLFARIDEIEGKRRKKYNELYTQLNLSPEKVYQDSNNKKNPSCLFLMVDKKMVNLSFFEGDYDFPRPLRLLHRYFNLNERYKNAENIYETIKLIQTY
jgi:dTDP-4-amino-4,6-dideoxygalactose transaminase